MARQCDVVFGCGNESSSQQFVPVVLDAGKKFIDLGGSYRSKDPSEAFKLYANRDGKNLQSAVYGLTELFAEKIRKAYLVANPGCYPTAFLLGMAPFFNHDLVDTDQTISITAISGYSGKGKSYKPVGGIHAYHVDEHRHRPEMVQACAQYVGAQIKLAFTPHVNDDVERGLETHTVFTPKHELTPEEIHAIFCDMYDGELLIQYLRDIPNINDVVKTNLCQISATVQAGVIKVIAMIDNLRKGAAAQAVQNMNLMFDLPKNTGLLSTYPSHL